MKRIAVNKRKAARGFSNSTKYTKAPNIQQGPMRGGWRL